MFDSIDRNKKSERRPHRNEVRISQLCLIRTLKMPISRTEIMYIIMQACKKRVGDLNPRLPLSHGGTLSAELTRLKAIVF